MPRDSINIQYFTYGLPGGKQRPAHNRQGSAMKIHHLNTGTMCPMGRRLVNGTGGLFQRARLVCHCLLVEKRDGLALVDTGLGLGDIATPNRLGGRWLRQTAPRLDPAETAVEQVKALGYSPGDVRHVL